MSVPRRRVRCTGTSRCGSAAQAAGHAGCARRGAGEFRPGTAVIDRLGEWFERRTGSRRIRSFLLDEPLPAGTGWVFTLGSVLLALLAVQLLTGAFLTLYY